MALELALRVDNKEFAVPKCTRRLSSPTTIGLKRTLPDVQPRHTTRKGGPEPEKRATNPRAQLPQRDSPARKVPRSGPTSQPPRDASTLPTRTGYHHATMLAPSLMPQLHDA